MSDYPSPTDSAYDARLETLELKLMDVENTVQELHAVILRQYRDIERLQLQQNELLNNLHGSADTASTPAAVDELPPHY